MKNRICCFVLLLTLGAVLAEPMKPPRELLQPLNVLVGVWNAGGSPEGSREEKQKGHWTETLDCQWKFKGDDAWIEVKFEKGKYFARAEIRPDREANRFTLKMETASQETWNFQGILKDTTLLFERTDEKSKESQKLTFSLLHDNRITYRFESKPAGKTFFTKLYTVGATKEGEEFAKVGVSERECVVSGGTGSTTVTYKGKTYYVCCSGCRDEFNASPEKYVTAFEKKRAASEKGKK
jgi:YHS domain-containing protein